jgi:hypothetical protein
MATWTPGPWRYDPTTYRIVDSDGATVAVLPAAGDQHVREANARLIAEAPALFEAVSEAQDLNSLLLAQRSWTRSAEEIARQTLERINATIARVMAWSPP